METIIASILGGLASGLFTFLGVWLTIRHENNKREKEKEELTFANRPRLEIIGCEKFEQYSEEKKADACILLCEIKEHKNGMFYYDTSVTKPENWSYVEYTLRNTGNTEIDHIYFSTNFLKTTSLFNVLNGQNVLCYKNHFLNYSVILEKNIKPQQSVCVRVCYIKDKVLVPILDFATITIWMIDEKNNWWSQSLFAPEDKLYNSTPKTHTDWKKNTSIETALRCFEDPTLW